jgi:hypothetical protein
MCKAIVLISNTEKRKKEKAGTDGSHIATWETEIRRIMIQTQSRQIVCKIPFPK